MRFSVVILSLLAVSACSSTTAELAKQSSTRTETLAFSENYQEIYRRVQTNAARCVSANVNAYASMAVDAQLYNELGFGEVSISMINMGMRNYYMSAKIEKTPAGSVLTVNSGNTANNATWLNKTLAWASGSDAC